MNTNTKIAGDIRMEASFLDELILSKIEEDWKKVAMIVARLMSDLSFNEMDVEDHFITERIIMLEKDRKIELRGNPLVWRESEARLHKHESGT